MRTEAILLVFAMANAAGAVDNEAFYAKRGHQIFKNEDVRDLDHGYEQGDEVPYFTWEGSVSGKPLYVEIHGPQIKIITGERTIVLPFIRAAKLAGGDKEIVALDEKGPDLYIRSPQQSAESILCIESLGPDRYLRPRPYREVYLVTDPFDSPYLYRLSGINASCKGVERTRTGKLIVPAWDIARNKTPSVVITYYAIGKGKIEKTDIRITGSVVDDYASEYEMDTPPTQ